MGHAKDAGDRPRCFKARLVIVNGNNASWSAKCEGDGEPAVSGADVSHHIIRAKVDEGAERPDIATQIEIERPIDIHITIDATSEMRDCADRALLLITDE